MIVGKTGPGKSVVWRTLQATLSTMKKNGEPGFNTVKVCLSTFLQFYFKSNLYLGDFFLAKLVIKKFIYK